METEIRNEEIEHEFDKELSKSDPVPHKTKSELEEIELRGKAKSDSVLHSLPCNIREG